MIKYDKNLYVDPDPLLHETDPRIWIRIQIKMKRIHNNGAGSACGKIKFHKGVSRLKLGQS